MNKNLGPKILELRNSGLTYNEIVKILNCSKSIVCYHCGNNQKEKYINRLKKYRKKEDPIKKKLQSFLYKDKETSIVKTNKLKDIDKILYKKIINFTCVRESGNKLMFSLNDLKLKIGDNPKCYLTGRSIDLSNTRSYNLDHIIPASKGGDNSLENCNIACRDANQAKNDMLLEDFYKLCEDVIKIRDMD